MVNLCGFTGHALSVASRRSRFLECGGYGTMSSLGMKSSGVLRFAVAVALIALTAVLLQARGRTEVIPNRLPLSSFPAQLGSWNSVEIQLDKDTLAILGAGDFM